MTDKEASTETDLDYYKQLSIELQNIRDRSLRIIDKMRDVNNEFWQDYEIETLIEELKEINAPKS
jgi:predicted  nucleic acid-binding Zn-ribbon protein